MLRPKQDRPLRIQCEAGDDYISGGEGPDTVWGGTGADAFEFRAGDSGTSMPSTLAPRMTLRIQPSSTSCFCRKLSCANFETWPLVTPAAAQGVMLYLHAGYWQSRDKSLFRFLAPAFQARGFHVALANYPLCPDVTLDELVKAVAPSVAAVAAPTQGLVMTGYQTQSNAWYTSMVTEYTFSVGGVVQQGGTPPATADWATPSNYWDGGWALNSWNERYTYSYQGQILQTTNPLDIPAAAAWATISSFQIEGSSFPRPIDSTVFHYSLDGIQTLLAMDASSIPANAVWAGLSSLSDGWNATQNHGFASYVLGRPVFSLAPVVDPQADRPKAAGVDRMARSTIRRARQPAADTL